MKLIATILFSLICFSGYSQTPYQTPFQKQGSPTTALRSAGGFFIDSTAVLPTYPDTTTANRSKTSLYAGSIIIVGNVLYQRSADITHWILIGGASSACPGTQLISGSISWSGSGLIYDCTDLTYYIQCLQYSSTATTLTLTAADPTFNRIDKFYANTSGIVNVRTGVPATNPQEPSTNALTEIDLGIVYIPAGSTIPASTTQTVIYNENIEWTGTSNVPSINFAYLTNPYIGTKSTLVPNAPENDTIAWQYGSVLRFDSAQYLKFWIRLNTAFSTDPLSFLDVSFYKNGTEVSQKLFVSTGTYNFDATIINAWQLVAIPLTGITVSDTTFNKVVFKIHSAPTSFQLDYVYILSTNTVPPQPNSPAWGLHGTNGAIYTPDPVIGRTDSAAFKQITNNQVRLSIPADGLQLSRDTTLRVMLWNPTDPDHPISQTYFPTIFASTCIEFFDSVGKRWIRDTCNHGSGGSQNLNEVTHVGDSTSLRMISEGIKLWGQGETDSALIQLNQRGTDNTFRALVAKPRRDSFPQFSIGYAFYPSASASPPYADSSNYVWNLFTNSDAAGNRINATKSSQGFSFETNFEDRGEGHWVFSPVTGAQQRIFSFKSKLDGTAIESYFTTDAQWMYDHNLNIYTRNDAGALALYANHPSLSFGGANANATPIPASIALDFLNYNGKQVLAKSTGGYGTSALYIGTTGDTIRTPARNLYLAYGQGAGRTNLSFEGSLFIPAHYSGALTYTTVNTDGTPSDATAQSFSFLKRLNNTAGINTPLGVSGVDMFINGSETYMPITDNWATFDDVGNSLRFPFNSTANKPTTNLGYNVFINTDSSNRMAVRQPGGGTYKTLAYIAQDSTATPQNIIWQDNNGTQHKGAYPSGGGSSPAGNYNAVQLNRNGQFDAMGSDSLIADGGLKVKGTMSADIVTSIIQVITPQITSGGVALNIEAANQVTTIGDPFGAGGGTKVEIDDNALTIASVATNGWTHMGNFNVNTATYTNGFLKVNNDGTFFIGDGAASDNNTYYKGDDVARTLNLRGDNGISMRGAVTMSTYTTGIATFGVGGGITSNPLSGLTSGTYTPTLSNTTNVTSSTPIVCHYTRVGNEVTVTGSVGVVTTLAVNTVLGLSLPIASNLGATTDGSGVGQASSAIAANAFLQANATTDVVELRFTGLAVSGSGTIFFVFSYTII